MAKQIIFETVGELFCGPGGSGLGASMSRYESDDKIARIKHLWATDYDQDSCNTYKLNIEKYERETLGTNSDIQVINKDINSSGINVGDSEQFPYVDGLIFGFPCNDFSLVGESKGLSGKFGPLYKHGITVLNRTEKPKWFIAENVSGLSSSNEGKAFTQILTEMTGAGYQITPHKYRFEEYGVPQARHRIVIVGILESLGLKFKVPAPNNKIKTAREALDKIPPEAKHQELTKQSQQVIERLKHTKPGENAWNASLPDHLKLNVLKTKLSHIYKRINPEKPSYTVTGSGGGGTHMYHWDEPRALTNRERARLQTFPDWFNFFGTKESIRKQIGMAIPPEGIRLICDALLASLNGGKYDNIDPNIN
jgi:DNA (cytosine-5)-methyltransferase 1